MNRLSLLNTDLSTLPVQRSVSGTPSESDVRYLIDDNEDLPVFPFNSARFAQSIVMIRTSARSIFSQAYGSDGYSEPRQPSFDYDEVDTDYHVPTGYFGHDNTRPGLTKRESLVFDSYHSQRHPTSIRPHWDSTSGRMHVNESSSRLTTLSDVTCRGTDDASTLKSDGSPGVGRGWRIRKLFRKQGAEISERDARSICGSEQVPVQAVELKFDAPEPEDAHASNPKRKDKIDGLRKGGKLRNNVFAVLQPLTSTA